MDKTIQQIEAHIDTTRDRLGANFQELERKMDAVTDWRQHFHTRPFTLIGVAFAGGVVLAATLRGRSGRRPAGFMPPAGLPSEPHRSTNSQKHQALETWDNIKGALIGVAALRFKEYVGEFIPGFNEQFRQTEQRAASSGAAAPGPPVATASLG